MRVGDAVVDERGRDGDLHEPDVARPERDDRRDVHQHEHEPGRSERLVDLECPHRRPDGEQLADPAEELERRRLERRHRAAHDREPLAGANEQLPGRPEPLELAVLPAGQHHRSDEQHDADADRERERQVRPSVGSSP